MADSTISNLPRIAAGPVGTDVFALARPSAGTTVGMIASSVRSYIVGKGFAGSDISTTAGIPYSALSLAQGIVNSDVSTVAAIAYSKLSLGGKIVDSDVSSTASITLSKLRGWPADSTGWLHNDGAGVLSFTTPAGSGGSISGSGTTGKIPIWTAAGALGDSNIRMDSSVCTITGTASVSGVTFGVNGVAYSWPSADGNSGDVIQTNGSATLAFVAPDLATLNTQTVSFYTLVLADRSKLVEMNNASANTVLVPVNSSVAYPVGTSIALSQLGAGNTKIAGDSGVSLLFSPSATAVMSGQMALASLVKRSTNSWYLSGDLTHS